MTSPRTAAPPTPHAPIDGVVPGVRGQRAFPTRALGIQDPFLMLDHIGPQPIPPDWAVEGRAHPHRGFETVTFVLSGAMEHADTLGNRYWMAPGSVLIMNAGRGIQHGGGMAARGGQEFHEVQLWLNTPADHKDSDPSAHLYRADEIPVHSWSGGWVRVIAGEAFGRTGPARATLPLLALHGRLEAAGAMTAPVPVGWTALAYPLRGKLRAGAVTTPAFGLLSFRDDGDAVSLQAEAGPAEFLLLAAPPLNEPVVMGGPFVMNTRAQIREAYADFRAGRFGSVPPVPPQTQRSL